MQDKVEVTQEDREAAASLIERYWQGAGEQHDQMRKCAASYRDGHSQGVWAEAFARHREQATASLREERDALREALLAVKERGLPDRYHSDAILARQVDDALSSALGEG